MVEKSPIGPKNPSDEDEDYFFEELVAPEGDRMMMADALSPPKEREEVRKLAVFRCETGPSMTLNEYGSNMLKSKFDSLAAIEAKVAMTKNPSNTSPVGKAMSEPPKSKPVWEQLNLGSPEAPKEVPSSQEEEPHAKLTSQMDSVTALISQDEVGKDPDPQEAKEPSRRSSRTCTQTYQKVEDKAIEAAKVKNLEGLIKDEQALLKTGADGTLATALACQPKNPQDPMKQITNG